ncbi:hypothetical protein J3998_08800 [Thiomicrorhabdus sp. 6S2-11]|uniref:Transcriptional regulator n=1 Tax=Thiomicrorhabdus marina TaxID=2818442 RepID=A0ABS3Q5R3_9GAMM|nr:NadS family protein [Thiomicrorhabdus marina]MBO1927673.1 hypothetical protein [Thiomicrorhabdus marina]
MANKFFDELKASLQEAVEIQQGKKAPSRVTRYEVADVKAIREPLDVSRARLPNSHKPEN